MGMISAKDVANNWGLSKRRVLVLCKEGRIPGAQMINLEPEKKPCFQGFFS